MPREWSGLGPLRFRHFSVGQRSQGALARLRGPHAAARADPSTQREPHLRVGMVANTMFGPRPQRAQQIATARGQVQQAQDGARTEAELAVPNAPLIAVFNYPWALQGLRRPGAGTQATALCSANKVSGARVNLRKRRFQGDAKAPCAAHTGWGGRLGQGPAVFGWLMWSSRQSVARGTWRFRGHALLWPRAVYALHAAALLHGVRVEARLPAPFCWGWTLTLGRVSACATCVGTPPWLPCVSWHTTPPPAPW